MYIWTPYPLPQPFRKLVFHHHTTGITEINNCKEEINNFLGFLRICDFFKYQVQIWPFIIPHYPPLDWLAVKYRFSKHHILTGSLLNARAVIMLVKDAWRLLARLPNHLTALKEKSKDNILDTYIALTVRIPLSSILYIYIFIFYFV